MVGRVAAGIGTPERRQMAAYWSRMVFTASARPPKEVASEQDMIDQVRQQPGRIGYVDRSAVDARVKILLSLP
jgi:hypothetical protein